MSTARTRFVLTLDPFTDIIIDHFIVRRYVEHVQGEDQVQALPRYLLIQSKPLSTLNESRHERSTSAYHELQCNYSSIT